MNMHLPKEKSSEETMPGTNGENNGTPVLIFVVMGGNGDIVIITRELCINSVIVINDN